MTEDEAFRAWMAACGNPPPRTPTWLHRVSDWIKFRREGTFPNPPKGWPGIDPSWAETRAKLVELLGDKPTREGEAEALFGATCAYIDRVISAS